MSEEKRDDLAVLQEKVAFLEQALQQLSDEHFVQQKELTNLHKKFNALVEKYNNQSVGDDQTAEIDDKPPHY